jgi:hypothetical protein
MSLRVTTTMTNWWAGAALPSTIYYCPPKADGRLSTPACACGEVARLGGRIPHNRLSRYQTRPHCAQNIGLGALPAARGSR